MKTQTTDFLIWEFISLFFVMTYSTVMDEIGSTTAIETTIGLIIKWVWLIMMIFSFAIGLLSLNRK